MLPDPNKLMVQVSLQQIQVLPGERVRLQSIDWSTFESILTDLGEHRSSRIAYFHGTLEIRKPLPEHEFVKEMISDLTKAILEELDIDFWPLGSTRAISFSWKP